MADFARAGSALTLIATAFTQAACWEMGTAGDAKIPGDLLGDYAVSATLLESTCGAGALGSEENWNFQVKLSRMSHDLYWLNGREAISGDIASDGVSFAFATQVRVPVREAGRGRQACVVWRRDASSGKLAGQGTDVPSFSGKIIFSYALETNADCAELMGVAGGFAQLPCEMTYAMNAARTSN